MGFISSRQLAVSAIAAATLLSGCRADPVSGYFFKLPDSSSASLIGRDPFGDPLANPSDEDLELPEEFVPNGILNGHFDLNTAKGNTPFPLGSGDVTYHVHQYDKVNRTTTVDFFKLSNVGGLRRRGGGFDQLGSAFAANKRFYLLVLNASLNPGAVLDINDKLLRSTSYVNPTAERLAAGFKPRIYTLGAPTVPGDQKLSTLKIAFDSQIQAANMLVPTSPTDCVFPNKPGPKGEYRNGALVIQAVDATQASFDPVNGSTLPGGSLLWEGVIYYHYMLAGPNGSEIDPRLCYQ